MKNETIKLGKGISVFCGENARTLFEEQKAEAKSKNEIRVYDFSEKTRCEKLIFDLKTEKTALPEEYRTAAFRKYLRDFIKNFPPQRLFPEKEAFLSMSTDGKLLLSTAEGKVGLSRNEKAFFQFCCFLIFVSFRLGFEEIRDMHCKIPTLYIGGAEKILKDDLLFVEMLKRAKEIKIPIFFFVTEIKENIKPIHLQGGLGIRKKQNGSKSL